MPHERERNPLTSQDFSEKSLELRSQRKNLPVWQGEIRNEFLSFVAQNQAVVLVSDTGSGKTTQLPQFLLEAGYTDIVCTQPRRVAAMSVSQRVADELDVRLGSHVGYSIRWDNNTSEETRIRFVTDGMLLNEATRDQLLQKYQVVILDEVHERSIATDVLFGVVQIAMESRPNLKVIVMSATMQTQKMQRYFNNAPLLEVPGRLYSVDNSICASPRKTMSRQPSGQCCRYTSLRLLVTCLSSSQERRKSRMRVELCGVMLSNMRTWAS